MSHPKLPVLNAGTATFDCVFPTCGGICCKNGRPGVEEPEIDRIQTNLGKFLEHLRPEAQKMIARSGFLSDRRKEGARTLRVAGGWCVFENQGCVLHKVGATEGDRFKYKPWRCVAFPLDQKPSGEWFVRQWGVEGEAWDLFCLNPKESPRRAEDSLQGELSFVAELHAGKERWRRAKTKKSAAEARGPGRRKTRHGAE